MLVMAVVFSGVMIVMRLVMPDYQRQRVGYGYTFVVILSMLDFIGDIAWLHQRFHAHGRGDEPGGLAFGICSLVFLSLSIIITGIKVHSLINTGAGVPSGVLLEPEKWKYDIFIMCCKVISIDLFHTMIVVSAANPDAIVFFPWTLYAYENANSPETPFPNSDALSTSLWKLVDVVPKFVIQSCFFAQSEWDSFTFVKLGFTFIMLIYIVIGKLLNRQIITTSCDSPRRDADVEMSPSGRDASTEQRLQDRKLESHL